MQFINMTDSTCKHKAIILVVSPFQYWCALEYLHQYHPGAETLVLDASGFCGNSTRQLQTLYRLYPPGRIRVLELLRQGTLQERIASYAGLATDYADECFDTIVIGDLRQQWMQDIACSVTAKQLIVVDDGAATNPIQRHVLKPAGYRLPVSMYRGDPSRRAQALAIKQELGLRIEPKAARLFSIFSFEDNNHCLRNDLSLLRQNWQPVSSSHREWHFIGSPVCEKGFVPTADYRAIVEDAAVLGSGEGQAIYFAHRSEDMAEKTPWLEQLGFQIEHNDTPYELLLAEQGRKPGLVTGLHSTCLFNLKMLFDKQVRACCYQLPDALLGSFQTTPWGSDYFSLYDHITAIYQRLAEFGIEIRMLSESKRKTG
ncbi:hypothetical protein [Alkalimonas amylolytica]|uniref:Uncharacterized protein n=1 Tax=Alkalimonas amylolytica TaxID=152573 RepID=A0A1H4B8T4_ALKAM|nr:hypothetical protein [Alkalimonas amylolytica]SEA44476.1 hypothetical protein SAMN04488051_103230 [Alkalimonas amylolytica]